MLALVGLVGSVLSRRLRIGLAVGVVVCALLSLGVRDADGLERYWTPFRFLFDFAPGWDGIRAPGRINTLTSLGLALLAGAGMCVVVATLRRRSARVALAAGLGVVVLLLLEGLGPLAHPLVPAIPPGVGREAAPQFHIPAGFHADLRHSYYSTDGFPKTVNGVGGIDPERYDRLRSETLRFPDERSVRVLRDLGVKTVIIHLGMVNEFGGWEGSDTRPLEGLGLERERRGDIVVFRFRQPS